MGWSAKCGCSHTKAIFKFLNTGKFTKNAHTKDTYNNLPNIILSEYTCILVVRNPYKRLVSGFMDKYQPDGEFRARWPGKLTFAVFAEALIKSDWDRVDRHHFTPQTSEAFDEKRLSSCKVRKVYDISDIDYKFLEKVFGKKIPDEVRSFRGSHIRKVKGVNFNGKVHNIPIGEYVDKDVKPRQFYNEKISKQIAKFYKNDFAFFESHGIHYTPP